MPPRIDIRAEGSTIHRLPQAFVSKLGEAILIRTLDDALCQGLIDMYLAYQPRNSFQGLPPIRDDACAAWVKHMISHGVSLVALSYQAGVVGHVALFPMSEEVCELLVVVSPAHQNMGIGTQLTRCCIQLAYEIGFDRIWLPVEARNARARHVYRKCGFEYVCDVDGRELEMSLDLKRYHDAVKVHVSAIMNPDVVAIASGDSCRTAVELFLNRRVASLPVVEKDGTLVGILSETDLMLPSNLDRDVRDVFTREVLSVRKDCTIAKIVRLFQSWKVRCIPVIDREGRLVGVVGRKDILAYYSKLF
jgi:CBS domain-containing protein/RimJ/RimL family protein N-acetyltransferase